MTTAEGWAQGLGAGFWCWEMLRHPLARGECGIDAVAAAFPVPPLALADADAGSGQKWGNSASVRIPAAVMGAARLALDQPVDIREEAGRVIGEPIAEPVFSLTDPLVPVTDETIDREIDFGPAVGKAVL